MKTTGKGPQHAELKVRCTAQLSAGHSHTCGKPHCDSAALSHKVYDVLFAHTLQAEYDDLVAADCVICGEMVIDLIDEPFISVDEQAAFMKSWSIPGQVAD